MCKWKVIYKQEKEARTIYVTNGSELKISVGTHNWVNIAGCTWKYF
jgi:hypothetical protein